MGKKDWMLSRMPRERQMYLCPVSPYTRKMTVSFVSNEDEAKNY